MATDATLRAIITVLDKTAEPLHAINARFAQSSSLLGHIGGRLGELAEETGLAGIGEHAEHALHHVKHLGEGLLEIVGPLLALGAAGSVGGLVEMAKQTAEFGEKLHFGAITAGLMTEELSGWHYAAQLANVDIAQLDKGLGFLNKNIALAAMGKSKDVQAILGRMGFSNTQGHLVGTADALRAVADEAKHLVDSGQVQLADAMMAKLFGKAGVQMLPVFAQGSEEIGKLLDSAKSHGIALSDEQAKNATEFADGYKQMSAAAEGLKLAIGARLFPALQPVIEEFTHWVDALREDGTLAETLTRGIVKLGAAFKSVPWEEVWKGLKEIANGARWVVDAVGGIGPALGIIAAIKFSSTILAFAQLGGAIVSVAAKFVLLPVASLIADFAMLIPAIAGATDAMAALSLAMNANPIGVVVLAVGALIAVGYELYEHWSELTALADRVWHSIPEPIREAVGSIGAAIFPLIGIPLEIYSHWSEIVPFFERLWDGVTGIFSAAWGKIQPIVEAVRDSAGWIGEHLPTFSSPAAAGAPTDEFGNPFPRAGAGTEPPLTQLVGGPGAAGAGAAQRSETKVTVDFKNMPQGVEASAETDGSADIDMAVGRAMAF